MDEVREYVVLELHKAGDDDLDHLAGLLRVAVTEDQGWYGVNMRRALGGLVQQLEARLGERRRRAVQLAADLAGEEIPADPRPGRHDD